MAPMRVASTAVSMVAWPLIMITGMSSMPWEAHSPSRLTPSVSGIQMSSNTRSGRMRRRGARLRRVFGQFDRVSFVVKDFRQEFANTDFVVNHQDSGHKASTYCVAALSFSCAVASIVSAPGASRVNKMEIRAPPSLRLARSIRPPCSSTILRTIANPNPVPWDLVVT